MRVQLAEQKEGWVTDDLLMYEAEADAEAEAWHEGSRVCGLRRLGA